MNNYRQPENGVRAAQFYQIAIQFQLRAAGRVRVKISEVAHVAVRSIMRSVGFVSRIKVRPGGSGIRR